MTRVATIIRYRLGEVMACEGLTAYELRAATMSALEDIDRQERREANERAIAAAERAGDLVTAEGLRAQERGH